MEQSRRLNSLLTEAGAEVTLVTVPGADHVFAGTDPRPQAERAVRFLREQLGLPTEAL
jgi:dipeptidyl aminopeptidase/acylaminoacyl peptidase